MSKPIMGTTAGATTTRIRLVNSGGQDIAGSKSGSYVDVSRVLSHVNQRLYRQGRMYMVRVGFATGSTTGALSVQALQNSWMVRKAWKAGLKAYNAATRDDRARSGQGRWKDFRIHMDDVQYDGGGTTSYTWAQPDGITLGTADDYQTKVYSQEEPGNGNLLEFHMIGSDSTNNRNTDSTGSLGLLSNYDAMDSVTVDDPPNPTSSAAAYQALNDSSGDDTQGDRMLAEGDFPPYNPVALQHAYQKYEINTAAANGPAHMTPWIAAPCGLLKLNGFGSDGTVPIVVEVMHGNYKGVLAEAI